MTVIGSVVTVIITGIMVGWLYFDPAYRDDKVEDVCIIDRDGNQWHTQIDTVNINSRGDPSVCPNSSNIYSQKGGPISSKSLYRATFNPAHWSPIFHN